jgi:vacuolar protein sorting-associated protein 11
LECYLNDYADQKALKLSTKLGNIQKSIKTFVKTYEAKIDKNYVLYLFRFYGFLDGIQELSQQLNMNQELLSVYIEKKEYNNIIKLCIEKGAHERDLWIQALNHFRDEGENYKLKECLDYIGENEILSPLMVLEILENTDSDLKYKYIKDYMIAEIKKLDVNIKESKEEIEHNMKEIDSKKEEYKALTSQPQLFENTTCSKCGDRLMVPTYHFMCGHVYHEGCVHVDRDTYKKY